MIVPPMSPSRGGAALQRKSRPAASINGRALRGLGFLLLGACAPERGEAPAPGVLFVDVTSRTGVAFRHVRCSTPEKHLVEMNGGGVSVIDYDGDGDLDLFFPQSAALPGARTEGRDLRDRMYRNDGNLRFVDVTDQVRCDDGRYTFSANPFDYDGDGDPDLFLCNFGSNRLLRNDDGVFSDVTESAGLVDEEWTSCAAFADFDQDGDLDVYVGNYCVYDLAHPLYCGDRSKGPEYRSYCHPDQYQGEQDRLFRNNGDGTFSDVTVESGMGEARGKCLGLCTCDYDSDGDVDLFVANDSTPRFLWRNDGGLRFEEVGYETGMAVSASGLSQASMGTDAADVDLDGDFDLVFTNLANEYNALIRNDGRGAFADRSFEMGIGEPSLPWVGFGVRFLDLELDGDEDMVVINGHVVDNIELYRKGETFAQPSHVYQNDGTGCFHLLEAERAGEYFGRKEVGRALATWDPDDDGDLDLIVVNNDGPAVLLENVAARQGSFIGFVLKGRPANTAAIGALVSLKAGGRRLLREQRGSFSYNSFHDLRVHFGLGESDAAEEVEIRWPCGEISRLGTLQGGRYHVVEEPARQ